MELTMQVLTMCVITGSKKGTHNLIVDILIPSKPVALVLIASIALRTSISPTFLKENLGRSGFF